MNVTGIMTMVATIMLILLWHVIKNKRKGMQWHRIMAVAISIFMVVHIIIYFIDYADYKTKLAV